MRASAFVFAALCAGVISCYTSSPSPAGDVRLGRPRRVADKFVDWSAGHPYQSIDSQQRFEDGHHSADSTDAASLNPGDYWLGNIDHSNSKSIYDAKYSVYRNVRDFGARGDGVHDDTHAIQGAISYGNRCEGYRCLGSTKTPALVYFPPGTYKVSSTIKIGVHTQLVGDAEDWPTIKATSNFGANVVVDGSPQDADGRRWHGNRAEFHIHKAIRYLKIDVTDVDAAVNVACLNWAVGQGTSLRSMAFKMRVNSRHLGVTMTHRGSGMFMGELSFYGGDRALTVLNQRFHFRNLKFHRARTAIQVDGPGVSVFQDIEFIDCGTGIDAREDASFTLLDSTARNVRRVITTRELGKNESGRAGSIVIDNLHAVDVKSIMDDDSNLNQAIRDGVEGEIILDTWTRGTGTVSFDSAEDDPEDGIEQKTLSSTNGHEASSFKPDVLLGDGGKYFTRPRPSYEDAEVDDIVNVKDRGARGDGKADDTHVLNEILLENAENGKITYFPHGIYVVTDTIYIPPNSSIIGEVWSTINARGSEFKDEDNPRPVVQVGRPGDVGFVEISDMLFESGDVLPGAILVEVNMQPAFQGAVAMWDSVVRVGGAASTGPAVEQYCTLCKAAFMMMHVRGSGGGYFENLWLWTADRMLDGHPGDPQIATGRGLLLETTPPTTEIGPTWFVGLAVEHHVLYNVNVVGGRNVFFGLVRAQPPVWQPYPGAPAGSDGDSKFHDPSFRHCYGVDIDVVDLELKLSLDLDDNFDIDIPTDELLFPQCAMSWAVRLADGARDVFSYGTSVHVSHNGWNDRCSTTSENGICQDSALRVEGAVENVHFWNLDVRGVRDLVSRGEEV